MGDLLECVAQTASKADLYVSKILRNMAEICEEMGVGEKTVKAWIKKGASIAVEGDGRRVLYSAEAATLQSWRLG